VDADSQEIGHSIARKAGWLKDAGTKRMAVKSMLDVLYPSVASDTRVCTHWCVSDTAWTPLFPSHPHVASCVSTKVSNAHRVTVQSDCAGLHESSGL
jgi:hypothetical protein